MTNKGFQRAHLICLIPCSSVYAPLFTVHTSLPIRNLIEEGRWQVEQTFWGNETITPRCHHLIEMSAEDDLTSLMHVTNAQYACQNYFVFTNVHLMLIGFPYLHCKDEGDGFVPSASISPPTRAMHVWNECEINEWMDVPVNL